MTRMAGPNDSRVHDPGRDLAQELASRLDTDEGQRLLRLLQMTGFLREGPPTGVDPATRADVESETTPRPIRIWQPREVDGRLVFVRRAPGLFGDHYADTLEIEATKPPGVRRVVWLGESAAAGYLYAPALTPAKILARHLEALAPGEHDVIDLARTNDRLGSLVDAVSASCQLDPDVFVIMAGNNWTLLETPEWSPLAPGVRARQQIARALRHGGLEAAVAAAARALETRVRDAWSAIATHAQATGADVVVVVPEVDVLGWPSEQPVHILPGDGVARWYAHLDVARRALDQDDPEQALAAARAMVVLDGGACSTSHRLRARAWLGLGRDDEAARAARDAIDAVTPPALAFLGAPQTTRPVRALLLGLAEELGFARIDLAEVFAAHTGHPAPNGRLFVDYCHFDAEGMAVAMAAVAAAISGGATPWTEVLERSPTRSTADDVEATARLGAALHSAHRSTAPSPARSSAIAEHLTAAMRADAGIIEAFGHLVRARSAPVPAALTRAQAENLAGRHRLTLQHGWRWDFLDADVLLVLDTLAPALDVRGTLVRGLGLLPGETVDLTEPPFLAEPLHRLYPEAIEAAPEPRAFHRAFWPETAVWLVSRGDRDVVLSLVARQAAEPMPTPQGPLIVSVAGQTVIEIPLEREWRRHDIAVDAAHLCEGPTRVSVRWPMPGPAGDDPLAPRILRLEQGLDAPLHPCFGELYALRARLADDPG